MHASEQADKKYCDDAELSHAFFPVPIGTTPDDSNSDPCRLMGNCMPDMEPRLAMARQCAV
jgi:hypothetical protein